MTVYVYFIGNFSGQMIHIDIFRHLFVFTFEINHNTFTNKIITKKGFLLTQKSKNSRVFANAYFCVL